MRLDVETGSSHGARQLVASEGFANRGVYGMHREVEAEWEGPGIDFERCAAMVA